MIRALLILLALTSAAQACERQTDMSPWGECGKPWPKGDRLAQQMIGPAFNLSAHDMEFYAAQTRKVEAEIARNEIARKCSWQKDCMAAADKPPCYGQTVDDRTYTAWPECRASSKCLSTGQPSDCEGWVCGSYGCVKPGR